MELIRDFTGEQYEGALSSWMWIGLAGKTPLCTSPFGDVFLQAEDGLWWLDTIGGELTRVWDSVEELEAVLNTDDGMQKYLLAGLALAVSEQGLEPSADQVYDFVHPPVLGGALAVGNVQVVDFVTALGILGQLHQQVRDIPAGTRIKVVGQG
ncbi:T6SS immunity protein Tdi1 domain-containing protein [Nocardia sp. NPDC052566]|uniref:T6SS immunity protein Tdi1 domain-containing protein n=1 Tax=Nocardia sp. NPDC052566 TaxID=3364330 RepID=UPI0037C5EEE6